MDETRPARERYPSDVSDDEWAFVSPYLALMREDAPQRDHSLREVFNGLRYIVKTGMQWRWMPHDLPPWHTVYQQTRRWLAAGCFEAVVHDLRTILRLAQGRAAQPSAAIFDSQTLQSTPESGGRAGYDGPSARRAPSSTWRWTRWATCWRCTSPRPTSRTVPRWRLWRPRCRR